MHRHQVSQPALSIKKANHYQLAIGFFIGISSRFVVSLTGKTIF
jgi:hypothetical protein